jgi:hypothetical protein
MKILSTPISVLDWFELNGRPHPVRMKIDDQEIKIQVISMKEEKIAGNWFLLFRCQSEINGEATVRA